jgi:hypothetical protein
VPAVRVAAGVIGAAFAGLAAGIDGDLTGMCGGRRAIAAFSRWPNSQPTE